MNPTPASEKRFAQAARALAQRLIAYAKDRREEDKKAISSMQTELCSLLRQEQRGELQ